MLSWSVVFLIVAFVAAMLGFGGMAASAAGVAKVLFFVFLLLFAASLVRELVADDQRSGDGGLPPTA